MCKQQIEAFFHCAKCLEELPIDQSPKSYSRTSSGWTVKGIQVWCNRHDIEIVHIDFKGAKVNYVKAEADTDA